jgi:putative colanic acid biosynthesis acetyltransferase WcaB
MSYPTFSGFCTLLASEARQAKGIRIKLLIILYRLASYGAHKGGLVYALSLPIYVLYRAYGEFLLGIELPVRVIAGPGLSIFHGHGLVVHGDTKIGARCTLRQGVTIGNKVSKNGKLTGSPIIGDDVEFGACSVVIGDVRIGSRVTIGACTAVTKDVPDDCIVVGRGMRLIPRTRAG